MPGAIWRSVAAAYECELGPGSGLRKNIELVIIATAPPWVIPFHAAPNSRCACQDRESGFQFAGGQVVQEGRSRIALWIGCTLPCSEYIRLRQRYEAAIRHWGQVILSSQGTDSGKPAHLAVSAKSLLDALHVLHVAKWKPNKTHIEG
jgi:hypothetical protein